MIEKDWTPADIGGIRTGRSTHGVDDWVIPRALTESEKQQVECYMAEQLVIRGYPAPRLPPDHPFYHPRPAPLDHLAPDHPWRTGTVPVPIR